MTIKYRRDIDGLRGISIIGVLLYHLDIQYEGTHLFKGGYLGVDVFFVISGFLITSIIRDELERSGTISLLDFYERRARRILPALTAVILVSIPFGLIILYPSQIEDFSQSIISTLLFISNIYWNYSLQQYGAESALIKPFLHTWSLSVEEQYYLIFPPLLLLLHKYLRPHIYIILAAALLVSLQLSEYITKVNPSFSFYMLPTRLWELLAGGLISYKINENTVINNNSFLHRWAPTCGLLLIVIPFLTIQLNQWHPGVATLLPVSGTMMIIYYSTRNNPIYSALSNRTLVAIGLISYSLYLWHYPIFSLGRILSISPGWEEKALWLVLAATLSTASFLYIEKPFRNKEAITRRWFFLSLGTVLIASLTASAAMREYSYTPSVDVSFESEMKKRDNWKHYGYDVCTQLYPTDCHAAEKTKKTILVVGDSMVPDAARILAKQFPDYRYILSWSGWCVPTTQKLRIVHKSLGKCNLINESRFNPDALKGVDGVAIITMSYHENTFMNGVKPSIGSYIKYLQDNDIKDVLVIGSYLSHKPRIHDLHIKHKGIKDFILKDVQITNRNNDEELEDLAKHYGINFISIRKLACDNEGECKVFIGNAPYSWDNHHWSAEFTDYLSNESKVTLHKIFD